MAKQSWGLEVGAEIAPGRRIVSALGGGVRYEVFLVWDELLCARAVAKVLRPDRAEDSGSRSAMKREGRLLARLAHPSLLRGFDLVADGPYPHVLIEHLTGSNLRRIIKRDGSVPLERLLPIGLGVASALAYLAASEVVHLDVKPSNIVASSPPTLIDLSLARSVDAAARITALVGTDGYMAPEQCDHARAAHTIGPAADVFGLGATLFHGVAGRRPFPRSAADAEHPSLARRYPQTVAEPGPLPDDAPPGLRELLLRMIGRDPDARPTARDVVEELEELCAEHAPRALRRRGRRPV